MNEKPSVFDQHTRFYLDQVARMDFAPISDRLGVTVEKRTVVVPVFGRAYRITSRSVCRPDGRPADYTTTVIVCRYLLECPDFEPVERQWQSFRDFPDAAPLVSYFTGNVEKVIADRFSGRLERLRDRGRHLGGRRPSIELSYDFVSVFNALPRVSVLLLFNEADEDFPAQSSVLFERRARHYLDMECLAMLGTLLVKRLERSASVREG